MYYKKTVEEAKRTVEGIKQIAPDINTGDHKPEDLERVVASGEAHDLHMDNLRGQVSAGVVTTFNHEAKIREIHKGIVHGIRASKHPKRDELLRFIGYKMPWEFGGESAEESSPQLPPSGEAPAAAA